jgi:iron complex outermembrane receptor protein
MFSIEVYGRNIFNKAYRAYTLNLGALGTTSMYKRDLWGERQPEW